MLFNLEPGYRELNLKIPENHKRFKKIKNIEYSC